MPPPSAADAGPWDRIGIRTTDFGDHGIALDMRGKRVGSGRRIVFLRSNSERTISQLWTMDQRGPAPAAAHQRLHYQGPAA